MHTENHFERTLRIEGSIRYETRDATTGELIPEESGEVHNIVTDVGIAELIQVLVKASYSTGYRISVGTGTTTPAASDTALVAQVFIGDVTSSSATSTTLRNKLFLAAGDANGSILAEAGLSHDGVLIDRALLSPTIAKTASKTVTVQVDITLSR